MNTKKVRSCGKKKKYSTKEAAQSWAGSLHRKGIQLKPHLCEVCGGWHLCRVSRMSRLNKAFISAGLESIMPNSVKCQKVDKMIRRINETA